MADKDMKWKCGAHGCSASWPGWGYRDSPLLQGWSNGYAREGRNLAKPDGGSAMEVFCKGKVNIKHYKDGNRFRKDCWGSLGGLQGWTG